MRSCEVTSTYIDEDGDVITISTDDELEDALAMVATEAGEGKKQVLKIDATAKEVVLEEEEKPKATTDSAKDAAKETSARTTSERKLACGSVGNLQWDLLAVGEGDLDAESKDVAERLVKDIVGSIALESEIAPAVDKEEYASGEKKKEAKKEDEVLAEDIPKAENVEFIHARHTCDGCGISPIVGTRYHATDRTDYDVCQGCFSDPSVDAFDRKHFVTQELDRDRVMQPRWSRRFSRGGRIRCGRNRRCHGSLHERRRQVRMGRHCPVPPAQQRFAETTQKAVEQKNDDTDKELQEAVLRSIQKANAVGVAEVEAEAEADNKEYKKETKDEDESERAAPPEEDAAASWRNVAGSFSSAAAGSGDFSEVLGAVASVVASEIEKHADTAADATHSAGMAAAGSARSASTDSVSNGIAAAIDAALKASRVASTVASEVKSVIDKELKKQQPEMEFPASAATPSEESENNVVEDIPGVEGDVDVTLDSDKEAKNDTKNEEELIKEDNMDGDELVEDNESEWEDVGSEENKAIGEGSSSSPAAIAPPVLARWADQLKVLRQLGFTDDHMSVDALETLHAANMGVDSTDEVTVGDAVNYLLKKAEE
mmetsp:Transcript_63154/g.186635  ORF Transcript_63154/g.186635 Transcript_63154/m.186635 type:complete len:601 (+) Transcript_63154:750-2552(+)